MPNRLAKETSPYLLQHANNPVDWYPWGPEALARAQSDQKPIFLSVGYAACHWCHVMEHESFEDEQTARYLNDHFVPIKVDREERPDLDAIYMEAVQALTGRGGWPMSVFLTPDGKPFYGGTYYPNTARYGMPSFRDVLEGIAEVWSERRGEAEESGNRVASAIAAEQLGRRTPSTPVATSISPGGRASAQAAGQQAEAPLDAAILDKAVARLADTFDWANGSWGGAPKFPQSMTIEFLLRRVVGPDDSRAGPDDARGLPADTDAAGPDDARAQPADDARAQSADTDATGPADADTRDGSATPNHDRTHERLLRMVTKTLDAMANGGIRDQLGGGFHRYSTDEVWLAPHFEKMLYDNAQLARVYLHAWQLTRDPRYREIVESTIDYVAREMTVPEGGFTASQDADSEGEEGRFYVWTLPEIQAVLGDSGDTRDDAALFATAYDVRTIGNWEGKTILRRMRSDVELEALFGSPDSNAATPDSHAGTVGLTAGTAGSTAGTAGSTAGTAGSTARSPSIDSQLADTTQESTDGDSRSNSIADRLVRARQALFEAREKRIRPARDDKALASWNGLMLAAVAEAARALDRADYRDLAERNAAFVLERLRTPEGRLRRSWKDGRATLNGYLEDYANVAEGLLALYETTFEPRWFVAARELMDAVLEHFTDPDGGFFDTSDDHEALVARPKGLQDNAVPSGSAMAVTVLLKLAAWTGEGRYRDAAEAALRSVEPYLGRYPTGFAQWLGALDFALAPVREIAIAGDPRTADTQALLAPVRSGYRPHQVVAAGVPADTATAGVPAAAVPTTAGVPATAGAAETAPSEPIPLLADRPLVGGKPTAYVCLGFVCDLPITDPSALAAKLLRPIT